MERSSTGVNDIANVALSPFHCAQHSHVHDHVFMSWSHDNP